MSGTAPLPRSTPRHRRSPWSLLLALVLMAYALTGPTLTLRQPTPDVILVFDVTQSMNVTDYDVGQGPISRFERARLAVRRSLASLPCGARVGYGALSEYRTMLLLAPIEVCAHYNDLLGALDRFDPLMRWGNSSEIGKGVFWAMRAAKDLDPQPGVVVFTDGHEAPPRRLSLPLWSDLQAGEVQGVVIAVGGHEPRPIPRTDDRGRATGYWKADEVVQWTRKDLPDGARSHEHLSWVHEDYLRDLAKTIGFGYAYLGEGRGDDTVLRRVLRSPALTHPADVHADIAWVPTLLALLCAAARFIPWRALAGRQAASRAPTGVDRSGHTAHPAPAAMADDATRRAARRAGLGLPPAPDH